MSEARTLCWDEYARYQHFADTCTLDRRAWGHDEALSELLTKLETSNQDEAKLATWLDGLMEARTRRLDRTVSKVEALRAWLKNLQANRSKKIHARSYGGPDGAGRMAPAQTNRSKKIHARSSLHDGIPLQSNGDPDVLLMLEDVRSLTTSIEWRALWSLAKGDDYLSVAGSLKMPVGTLKSLVSRCRSRLKRSA